MHRTVDIGSDNIARVAPRHHTVPQVYLRNFANAAGQVALVNRDDLTCCLVTAVRKACAEVGFYRLDPETLADNDGQPVDPEMIERHLSQFETTAAPGIHKLVTTGLKDLTRVDWYHLINFIALQTVRGPRFREDLAATGTQALRVHLGESVTDDMIRDWLSDRGDPATDADVAAFREGLLGANRPRLVPSQEVAIREGLSLALGALGERLASMEWSVIDAVAASVLTSDEPVCWWSPGNGPIGHATARVVWIPVNRKRILQLRDRTVEAASLGLPDQESEGGADEMVSFVNGLVATQATRWIVHHPDDSPLEGVTVGPRTAWADELVAVEETQAERREVWVHRRLPVQPQESATKSAGSEQD